MEQYGLIKATWVHPPITDYSSTLILLSMIMKDITYQGVRCGFFGLSKLATSHCSCPCGLLLRAICYRWTKALLDCTRWCPSQAGSQVTEDRKCTERTLWTGMIQAEWDTVRFSHATQRATTHNYWVIHFSNFPFDIFGQQLTVVTKTTKSCPEDKVVFAQNWLEPSHMQLFSHTCGRVWPSWVVPLEVLMTHEM